MLFESVAHAMGSASQGGGQAQNPFVAFTPLILMFVIFYFLLIRPQQKKSKQHKEMLGGLKKGDHVITAGGMYGRITAVEGDRISVELAKDMVVDVNRSYIAGMSDTQPERKEKEKEDK